MNIKNMLFAVLLMGAAFGSTVMVAEVPRNMLDGIEEVAGGAVVGGVGFGAGIALGATIGAAGGPLGVVVGGVVGGVFGALGGAGVGYHYGPAMIAALNKSLKNRR